MFRLLKKHIFTFTLIVSFISIFIPISFANSESLLFYSWEDFKKLFIINFIKLLYYIFLFLPELIIRTSGNVFDFAIEHGLVKFANYYNQYFDTAIDSAWTLTRDVANIIIISMFVFVAIGTILRLKNYNLEKFAVKIIIIAVLINFSMFFVKFAIDVSNLFAYQLYKGIENTFGAQINTSATQEGNNNSLNISKLISLKLGTNKLLDDSYIEEKYKSGKTLSLIITIFTLSIILSFVAGVFIYGSIVIFTRILGLLYVIALSAAAFVAIVVPKVGEDFFSKWIDNLVRYTLFAPVFMLSLFVSLQIIVYAGGGIGDGATIIDLISQENDPASFSRALLFAFLIVGALFATIKIANSLSIIGASFAADIALRVGGAGVWATKKAVFQPAAAGLFRVANSKLLQNTPFQLYAAKMYDIARAPVQSKLVLDQFGIKRRLSYGDKKIVKAAQEKRKLDMDHSITRSILKSFKKDLTEKKAGSSYQMPQSEIPSASDKSGSHDSTKRDTTVPELNMPNIDDSAARAQEEAREAGELEKQQSRASKAAEAAREAAREVAESEFRNLQEAQAWVDSISNQTIDYADDEAELRKLYAERIKKILSSDKLNEQEKLSAIAYERNIMMDKLADIRKKRLERDRRYNTVALSKKTAKKLEAAKAIAKKLEAKLNQGLIGLLDKRMQDKSLSGDDRRKLAILTEEILTSEGSISDKLKRAKNILNEDTRFRSLSKEVKEELEREIENLIKLAQNPRDFLKLEAIDALDKLVEQGYDANVINEMKRKLSSYNGSKPVEYTRSLLFNFGFNEAVKQFDSLHEFEKAVHNTRLHVRAVNRALSSKNTLSLDEMLKKYENKEGLVGKLRRVKENAKTKISHIMDQAEEQSSIAQAARAAARQAAKNIKETNFGFSDYKSEDKNDDVPNPVDLFKYEKSFVEELKDNLDSINEIAEKHGLKIKKTDDKTDDKK